jgi:hypothetical protein
MFEQYGRSDHQIIHVQDNEWRISIGMIEKVIPPDLLPQVYAELYGTLAEDFLTSPQAAHQETAAIIMNADEMLQALTPTGLEQLIDSASAEGYRTQQYLYRLFQRPVLQISTLPPQFDAESIQAKLFALNPSGNQMLYTDSMDSALALAQDLLRIAHGL